MEIERLTFKDELQRDMFKALVVREIVAHIKSKETHQERIETTVDILLLMTGATIKP